MIERIKIDNLFGYRNVDLNFNKDVTFIIGRNGSGKTTILNILTSLISGNLDFLTRYKMDNLVLIYKKNAHEIELKIERVDFDKFVLSWKENYVSITLTQLMNKVRNKMLEVEFVYYDEPKETDNLNNILKLIAKEFNYLYLPLSRDTRNDNNAMERRDKKGRFEHVYTSFQEKPISNIDNSLLYVHNLVKERQRKIMLRYDDLNKKMQKEMFQEAFVFDQSKNLLDTNMDDLSSLITSQNELKEAFKELDMLPEDFQDDIDEFFTKLERLYKNYIQWNSKNNKAFVLTNDNIMLIKNSSQIQRIQNWTKIVLRRNKAKTILGKAMENFFSTVNSYLEDSGKKIKFNDKEGLLEFSTNYDEGLPIESLSSGEKQIIIFFAYLILGINESKEGTFIVDEPELSLHLKWQQRFSEDIMKVNPKIQLIFATHSPEIVGKLRDKILILGGDH